MGVFESCENPCEDGLLLGLFEDEVELFELFTDEPNSEDGDLFDDGILVLNVVSDFLDDSRPLIFRQFDAANGCNDVGSCSPDKLLWVDHGVEDHIFEGRPVGSGQSVPEIAVVVFGLERDREQCAC